MGIRRMLATDISGVVEIHLQSFPHFFLSFLGPGFLKELYTGILEDPSGISYVYEDKGGLLGFVAGTDQPGGFYRRLLRQRILRFGWASLGPVLRRPAITPRLLRAFHMPRQAESSGKCGTLMSIAVAPQTQGMGIGKQLVQAFLDEAALRGLTDVNLTTDRRNNEATNQFYLRYGFQLAHTYTTPEGREMNEYRIKL
jgi:ribosomal protein S18 acetylase RimI-like enzyme